jgi:hypothetical protein
VNRECADVGRAGDKVEAVRADAAINRVAAVVQEAEDAAISKARPVPVVEKVRT